MSDMPTKEQRLSSAALANSIREGEWDKLGKNPPYNFNTHSLITGRGRGREFGAGGSGLFSRLLELFEHVKGVMDGTEEVRHPEYFGGVSTSIPRDILMASSHPNGPYAGYQSTENATLRPEFANQGEGQPPKSKPIGLLDRPQSTDPIAKVMMETAKELGVKWQDLSRAIAEANAGSDPSNAVKTVEKVAKILGIDPQKMMEVGLRHGFTIGEGEQAGKIIIDLDVARQNTQKISASMLEGFKPAKDLRHPDQGKINDDMPQGSRVVAAAGREAVSAAVG